jgi:hypothetical protein
MSIKKIWTSRSKQANATTYIGEAGSLFYNEVDGELRLSDGHTPGGVAISVRADLIVAQRLTPGVDNNNAYGLGDETHRWWDLHIGDGGIHYNGFESPQTVPYRPGAQVDDIIPVLDNDINLGATDKRFANIYLGYEGLFLADQTTDENINITVDQGTLYIDGAQNLRLGNLVIEDTTLKSSDITQDINIGETNDTGFFYVRRKAQFDNTTFNSTEAMVSFNGSGGADPATVFPDTILQTVSRPNKNSRIIQRAYGSTGTVGGDNSYAVWGSYAARGNTASPAALKANDILMRLSGNGYGTSTWGSGGARVEFVALENFTDSAKGTTINFWTTPEGQITSQNVASIDSTGVVTAGIKFSNDDTLQTTAGIPLTQKAVPSASYVATLGVDGKLDASQIPSSLTGAIVFKGVWNATTNTPTLSNSLPAGLSTGWEYIVEVGGTRDIGDGSKTFLAGDFVIFDGTHWKQVPSGNAFISLTSGGHITVNQTTGAMTLGSDATPNATNSTIVSRDASGNFSANVITASLSGNVTGNVTGNVSGNAGTVTNGVYTNGSYSDPTWLTISKSKVGLSAVENTALSTSTHYIGTTSITYNKASASQTLTVVSIDGNAGTVTNGVYTNGSYANPSWITSLAASKVGLGSVENTALSTSTHYIGTTSIQYNRASAAQSLTGVSIDGSAGSVAAANITGTTLASNVVTSSLTTVGTLTNLAIAANGTITTPRIVINDGGIRTVSGGTTLTIDFATDSIILWTAPSGTAVITLSNYTAGAQVKLIIALTTSRDITFGIAGVANSSTGSDNWNGAGGGAVDISNTAVHLEYTCITALAAGCYVKVIAN